MVIGIRLVDADPSVIAFWHLLAIHVPYDSGYSLAGTLGTLQAFKAIGISRLLGKRVPGAGIPLYVLSITRTTVANTVVLLATAPFFSAILGWLVLKERVRMRTWLAVFLLAMTGVFIMVLDSLGRGRLWSVPGWVVRSHSQVDIVTVRVGRRVSIIPPSASRLSFVQQRPD